jgi:hypothetical protein
MKHQRHFDTSEVAQRDSMQIGKIIDDLSADLLAGAVSTVELSPNITGQERLRYLSPDQ